MLPPAYRLRLREDFSTAVRGVRAGRSTVVAHVSVGTDAGSPARVGVAVSRAVGGSVVRNRVKRRLRHIAGPLLADLPADTLVVLRALPAAANGSYLVLADDVAGAVGSAVRKAGRSRS